MRRSLKIALGIGVAAAVAVGGGLVLRGKTGASTEFGGSLEAETLADFPNLGPERWANGAPVSLAEQRGSVVLIEAWHPT
jgi:hypothetical protein